MSFYYKLAIGGAYIYALSMSIEYARAYIYALSSQRVNYQ